MTRRGYSELLKQVAVFAGVIGIAYGVNKLNTSNRQERREPSRYFNLDITLGRTDSKVNYAIENIGPNTFQQRVGVEATYEFPPIMENEYPRGRFEFGNVPLNEIEKNKSDYLKLFETAFEECSSQLENITNSDSLCPEGQVSINELTTACDFFNGIGCTIKPSDPIQNSPKCKKTLTTLIEGSARWECVENNSSKAVPSN